MSVIDTTESRIALSSWSSPRRANAQAYANLALKIIVPCFLSVSTRARSGVLPMRLELVVEPNGDSMPLAVSVDKVLAWRQLTTRH